MKFFMARFLDEGQDKKHSFAVFREKSHTFSFFSPNLEMYVITF